MEYSVDVKQHERSRRSTVQDAYLKVIGSRPGGAAPVVSARLVHDTDGCWVHADTHLGCADCPPLERTELARALAQLATIDFSTGMRG